MPYTRREIIKIGAGAAAAALTLSPRALLASGARVPVLMYHDIRDTLDDYAITPSLFSAQMEWLYSSGFRAISMKELAAARSGELRKAVVITFDDGYASFMDYALPLFTAYGFKANINIIGRYVGKVLRDRYPSPMLSWDEYRHLDLTGLVELGCHTSDLHTRRGVLSFTPAELADDLGKFQAAFAKEIGRPSQVIAWPYGLYDAASIRAARAAGFKFILTSNEGLLDAAGPYDEVPRLNITERLDVISFGQYIRGV